MSLSLSQDLRDIGDSELAESIARLQLLHPPVVKKSANDFYEIVCGSRRVSLMKTIPGIAAIECQVRTFRDNLEMLNLVLEEQMLSGPLSVIMKARFFRLCQEMLDSIQIKELLTDKQIGSFDHLSRLLPLLSLEQSIKDQLHQGIISEKTGLRIATYDPEDRLFICRIIRNYKLNANKQRNLLNYCEIIAKTEDISLKTLFSTYFPSFIPDGSVSNIPQNSARLIQALHNHCHPQSSAAKTQFKKQVASMKLPQNFEIIHSPEFERDTVELSITFKSLDRLKEKLELLRSLADL